MNFQELPFLLHPGILINIPYGWMAATYNKSREKACIHC